MTLLNSLNHKKLSFMNLDNTSSANQPLVNQFNATEIKDTFTSSNNSKKKSDDENKNLAIIASVVTIILLLGGLILALKHGNRLKAGNIKNVAKETPKPKISEPNKSEAEAIDLKATETKTPKQQVKTDGLDKKLSRLKQEDQQHRQEISETDQRLQLQDQALQQAKQKGELLQQRLKDAQQAAERSIQEGQQLLERFTQGQNTEIGKHEEVIPDHLNLFTLITKDDDAKKAILEAITPENKDIYKDVGHAIANDTKTFVLDTVPFPVVMGQMELWDANSYLREHKAETKTALEKFSHPDWFLNIPSISEKRNYIYTESEKIKSLLSKIIDVTFDGDVGITDNLWLRKEIRKKLLELKSV